ncbi:hypothetical protein [Spiroplasma floricola]|uniref:Uncharacterized protein n=1 Tax=Spiroplasma floricola 23-6 TaxID=1336749 RepID=A0A2K8SCZ4_9MOLU|nr:hypothetical protein [Spiroplasma floricola]AUB31331.1 hypothetical protein SFLOR_v1c02740 [Spiroplasma floricola 23-6]
MNLIIYILLAIAFTICFISLFAYFSITKFVKNKKTKFGIDAVEKASTIYNKILKEIGTIENIDEIKEEKIIVLSNQLVNIDNLRKLKIKAQLIEKELTLTSKEFSIKLFIKRLREEIKK